MRSCAAWLAAALLACAALTSCERNSAKPYLIPTGLRPKLTNPAGGVLGVLHYAPANRPDLVSGPFPPSRLELLRAQDSTLVAFDSLATSTNVFNFGGLQPGSYLVRAVVRGFNSPLVRVTVRDAVRDAGDLTLPINSAVYSAVVGLIGDMQGYDYENYFFNTFNSPDKIGVFVFPSDLHPDATVAVTAGIHEFMFVTDNSFPNDLIGWGGDASEVLTPPLVNHRATLGHGPANNLKVNFPTAGNYTFALDEARQTFTVTLATAAQNAHTQQTSRRIR